MARAEEIGKYVGEMPETGPELAVAWGIRPEDHDSVTVKVSRQKPGTFSYILLGSNPLGGFSLRDVARLHGPGKYLLKAGPGPYSAKQSTVELAPEYAHESGWQAIPETRPTAGDAFLQDRMVRATREPLPPVDVATMIELAVQKALNGARREESPAGGQLMAGFEMALRMMSMAKETVIQGSVEPKETTMGDVAMKYAPQLLGLLGQAMDAFRAPAPAPTPAHSAQTHPPIPAPIPPPAAAAPQSGPDLTGEDPDLIRLAQAAVGLLRPYAGILARQLAAGSPDDLASQILGMTGPDVWPALEALATLAEKHGPSVLAAVSPDLATPKARETCLALRDKIRAEYENT